MDRYFVLYEYDNKVSYISERQARIVRKSWAEGKPWDRCSPMYALSRAEVAHIVSMDESEFDKVLRQF